MKKLRIISIVIAILFAGLFCQPGDHVPRSSSGIKKAKANVKTQANGLTVEQENIRRRIEMENTPGSIKHLYIISAMSGQVLVYSTVRGKVTSSGKRLTPYRVTGRGFEGRRRGFSVRIGGEVQDTDEVLQDDGTYGSSIPYLYWWDIQDRYHQHYVSGGQIVHIADKPIPGIRRISIKFAH